MLQAAGLITLQSDRRVPNARVSGWQSIAAGGGGAGRQLALKRAIARPGGRGPAPRRRDADRAGGRRAVGARVGRPCGNVVEKSIL